MNKFYTVIVTFALGMTSSAFSQQTAFRLNGYKFLADTSFYNYATVIRCAKQITSEETPAAMCCKYPADNLPTKYYYTGDNYTCPRNDGKLGMLSHECHINRPQLRSAGNYARSGLTIQSMIYFCRHKP